VLPILCRTDPDEKEDSPRLDHLDRFLGGHPPPALVRVDPTDPADPVFLVSDRLRDAADLDRDAREIRVWQLRQSGLIKLRLSQYHLQS
jgi:hypothetical protein